MSPKLLEVLSKSDVVTFLTSKSLLANEDTLPDLAQLQRDVVKSGNIYAIDFTDASSPEEQRGVQKLVKRKFSVGFKCEILLITNYKNSLMFTPVDDKASLEDVCTLSVTDLEEDLKALSEQKKEKSGTIFFNVEKRET